LRPLPLSILTAAVALLAAPVAQAHVVHTVVPGDTLWSIAAQSNMTTRTVAAYNGLTESSPVVLGAPIKIPSIAEGQAALSAAGIVPAGTSPGTAASAAPAATATVTPAAPRPLGAYVVRPGDTLTGLAAQSGVPTAQMAYMNGLHPTAKLLIGTVMKLPSGAPAPPRPPPRHPTRASCPPPTQWRRRRA